MLPSELRLLTGIREALRSAIAADPEAKAVTAIAAANVGVDELLLRADKGFFSAHYEQGFALARDGAPLALPRTGAQALLQSLPPTLGRSQHGDLMSAAIESLQNVLTHLVTDLAPREAANPKIKAFLARVVDWENLLHATRLQRAAGTALLGEIPGSAFTERALEQYLKTRFPDWGDVKITGLRKLAGGFSKITILFDAEDTSGRKQALVIRAEQPVSLVFFDGAAIENEYCALNLAHDAGVRVAEPLWLEPDASLFGAKFLVSKKAAGRNIGTAVSVREEVSDSLLHDLVANLYRIHQVGVHPDNDNVRKSHLARWSRYRTLTESTTESVDYWRENVRLMNLPSSPLVARSLAWLANNVPECDESPSLIHRDYGLHNVLVHDDRVSCILDWESATMGDPAEDLAWMTDSMKAGIDRQRVLDLYAEISGRAVPERRLRFFEVFTSLKYAVICAQALSLFERNTALPINACQLGLLYAHHGTAQLNHHIEMAETIA